MLNSAHNKFYNLFNFGIQCTLVRGIKISGSVIKIKALNIKSETPPTKDRNGV